MARERRAEWLAADSSHQVGDGNKMGVCFCRWARWREARGSAFEGGLADGLLAGGRNGFGGWT